MAKNDVLEIHGTIEVQLKPQHLIQAAEADLRRVDGNRGRLAFRPAGDSYHPYAFHRKHVRKAKTPGELIQLALAETELGCASGKRNTRMIYRNVPLLLAAWELA